jgi:hypothetical protein
MRWKIIIVNALIVLVVGVLTYVLLATSLSDVVHNSAKRKTEVAQALRAANSQLALDALRLERWLAEKINTDPVRGVFAAGTPTARSEAATAQANKIRDAAVNEAMFAKMAPSLVLFVDANGVAFGRNGSALMRGDRMSEAYPSLEKALSSGNTMSAIWMNRQRQEQMLASYAPVRNDEGQVVGAVVIGTPLNDERLTRTSELTSGHYLVFGVLSAENRLELVANSGQAPSAVVEASASAELAAAAQAAVSTSNVTTIPERAEHVFGTAPVTGYVGEQSPVLMAAIPASLVGSLGRLLWPVFGVTILGIALVLVGGVLLGNYFTRPVAELEDGLLAIINGKTDLRFQIEHPDLGGLVFRINSLLNALMGVPEDTTDDEGRQSVPAQSPAAFDETMPVEEGAVSPEAAAALASEPEDRYYGRLFDEYLAAKRGLGETVDHITREAFVGHIRQNEMTTAQKIGRAVRYAVKIRNSAVVLVAVPLPG